VPCSQVMKTYLTYGFAMAMCGAVLGMALYFLGFNSDVSKLEISRWISGIVGVAIAVGCILLGMREKRELTPVDQTWGYGSAFVTGFLIGLIGTVLSAIFNYAYFAYIDPNLSDLVYQMQVSKMEAKGMSADQIEKIEPMMRKFIGPVAMTISGLVGGLVFNTVISLITAAFVKNRSEPPAAAPAAPAA
ncbi:MAG: DUF4199 domain-containing protein, partial [Opitutales bacterium]